MPVRVSNYLADTLHFLPLEILAGDNIVLARITGSAPKAWNSRAVPAHFLEIYAGHWHRGHTRQERSRTAANPQSNPNKARLAARGRSTTTAAAKVSGRRLLAFQRCNRYCTMRSRAWRCYIEVPTRVSAMNSPRFFRHHLGVGMTLPVKQPYRVVSA
jgi:hypothetical protein